MQHTAIFIFLPHVFHLCGKGRHQFGIFLIRTDEGLTIRDAAHTAQLKVIAIQQRFKRDIVVIVFDGVLAEIADDDAFFLALPCHGHHIELGVFPLGACDVVFHRMVDDPLNILSDTHLMGRFRIVRACRSQHDIPVFVQHQNTIQTLFVGVLVQEFFGLLAGARQPLCKLVRFIQQADKAFCLVIRQIALVPDDALPEQVQRLLRNIRSILDIIPAQCRKCKRENQKS